MGELTESYREIVQEHRSWLTSFPPHHLDAWEALLRSDEEAGLCEACVRKLLQKQVDEVAPAEDPDRGGPDFVCLARGERFYVEATCLTTCVVTKRTGLRAEFVPGAHTYRDLTALVLEKAKNKAPQCSGLDAPCLLAVGTFHFEGSELCGDEMHVQHLLTSTTGISMAFDAELGESVGPMVQTTDLRFSSVIRPRSASVEAARRSISGILLCGFGCKDWRESWPARGVLHPDAARPFRRELLPTIRFAELKPGYDKGTIGVEWT